ncbi:MAG: chorismate mutase [Cytophagales bacterium]|nr:chorismate mutase [Cytophagales bacterium]
MKEVTTIDQVRKKIDEIDRQLLDLLNRRMELVQEVGKIKKISNATIYRPEREREIIERLSGINTGKLNQQAIEAIFLEIFAVSRNIELPEKVAYLGPEGSFTHQAAEARFGAMSEYMSLNNIQSVFEAVISERVKYGIVPIENNQQGIVGETMNQLSSCEVNIVSEVPMPIHFSFASQNENLNEIQKVYSKDIAFRQCSKFIKEYIGTDVHMIPVESTSKAALLASTDNTAAVICSHIAAKMYNLPILFANIQDSADNYTRFLILSKSYKNAMSDNDKTTILARISDKPGSLVTFLQKFHETGVNFTKIESYPAKDGKRFKYWFFIEFDGHVDDPVIHTVMQENIEQIKWLGSYPKLC